MIFGWRLTNKPVQVESEQVKELHELLKDEKLARESQAKESELAKKKLGKELQEAKKLNNELQAKQQDRNRVTAIKHLKIAERYEGMMELSTGSRQLEMLAIVAARIEAVEGLGIKVNGVTKTLNRLL